MNLKNMRRNIQFWEVKKTKKRTFTPQNYPSKIN